MIIKKRKPKNWMIFFICTVVIFSFIFNYFLNTNKVLGSSTPPIKSYITITVKPHDTLWDLANLYMNTDFYNQDSYIKEVVNMNHINNFQIYAGDCLTLPIVE